ncbi:hypothetical protein HanPSC8_Chr13g0589241 [Helianthus annuus]|nr:hypothetical protein HanPSC8_Chr13g0589241 [Helianthus annuus]
MFNVPTLTHLYSCICFFFLPFHQTPTPPFSLSLFKIFHLQMDIRTSETPCKIRKRRFRTASSSSFANNNLAQFLVEKTDLSRNEKCVDQLEPETTVVLPKSGSDGQVKEVINPHYRQSCDFMEKDNIFGGTPLTYNTKQFEAKSRTYDEMETVTKDRGQPKSTHGLDEIKHALTVSKEILKLLAHVWTTDTNHGPHHPTSISLASTLNHELNKARSHVNKLIQEQRSNQTCAHKSKEQDKIRFAVKTISRELETERKLRRQAERMNKKLGRELVNTKSSLAKAVKEAESEKQVTAVLDGLCQKMVQSIEEQRVELEELKKESERVRKEIEEEREMLRVADMLREERVHMKLVDAKHEYEDKHKQVDILARDLEELLEVDNGIHHITPRVLSWYQSTDYHKGENKNENDTRKVVNDGNTLGGEVGSLSWFENNKGEVINDDTTNTNNEVAGRNSDCIEWEFELDMKNDSGELNECLEERVLGLSGLSTMKEYEDEMKRYKMIKDLRDRIVSGSDLS